MPPRLRQHQLALELLRFDDPQERLSYVVDRVRKLPPWPHEERLPERLIPGCATKVWLRSHHHSNSCLFEVDSESPMVRGLASLIAHVYSESSPADIVSFAETLLEEAKLERMVTPTRQHGLAQLRAAIRTFAQHQITGPATLPPAGSP